MCITLALWHADLKTDGEEMLDPAGLLQAPSMLRTDVFSRVVYLAYAVGVTTGHVTFSFYRRSPQIYHCLNRKAQWQPLEML